jgi:hypothetical protein
MPLKSPKTWQFQESSELRSFIAQLTEDFDPMLSQKYAELNQTIFTIDIAPEAILDIDDIAAYNKQEGLSLSPKKWNT